MNEPAGNQSCWDFVVELYAKPNVSQACLTLQDRLGVDVTFLLVILFYATCRGVDFSPQEIASLDLGVSAWRNQVITPLRELRRRVKTANLQELPTEALYQRIKADELLAERLEIDALGRLVEQMPTKQSRPGLTRDVIENVVKHFAEAFPRNDHLSDDTIQRAISVLYESAR